MHVTQVYHFDKSCKPSVRFNPSEDEESPLTSSFYLNRAIAKEELGVKNLDNVEAIEITVRIKTKSDGKKSKNRREEEEE